MTEWSQSSATDRVSTTWTSLAEMFGSRFTREYGDSAPETWRRTIESLNDFELARGLRRLLQQGSGSPPTLPQFVKACRAADPDDVVRPAATFLPPPVMDSIAAFGNRVLLGYLMDPRRKNPSETSLQRMVEAKNRIIDQFRQIERDDPTVKSEEIRAALFREFDRQFEAMSEDEYEAGRQRFIRTGNACHGAPL